MASAIVTRTISSTEDKLRAEIQSVLRSVESMKESLV
jgi:hypothetical protein